MEGHVPQVFCMSKWARVEKVDNPPAKKVIDAVFALRVSLHSLDYIIEEDLRSFGLALMDDYKDSNFLSVVSTLIPVVTLSPKDKVAPTKSPAVLPAIAKIIPTPRGILSLS